MDQKNSSAGSLIKVVNLLGTMSLVVGVGLGVYYVASGGSSVDESGLLVEEFWALGSAWIFILASVFMAMLGLVLRLVTRRRT